MGYLTNFIVYTFAMVGVMMLALFVFKHSTAANTKGSTKFLKVIDTMSIGPRKTLYIVAAGNEKFLIAGDVDKTSLISKLESSPQSCLAYETKMDLNEAFENVSQNKNSYLDRTYVSKYSTQNKSCGSVMKNLAEVLRK